MFLSVYEYRLETGISQFSHCALAVGLLFPKFWYLVLMSSDYHGRTFRHYSGIMDT